MNRITGNHRIIYQCLQRLGGGKISYGALAITTGYHRNTVRTAVRKLSEYGLLSIQDCGKGRPKIYTITAK